MKARKKYSAIGFALVAAILVYFAPPAAEDVVALSEHSATVTAKPASAPSVAIALQPILSGPEINVLNIRPRKRTDIDDEEVNVFTSTQWTPPAPKLGTKLPHPLPENLPVTSALPPLPFHVLGHYIVDDQVICFLQYKDQNLTVRVGDIIAEQYKVESLEKGILTLRYIPLNEQQTLEIGS